MNLSPWLSIGLHSLKDAATNIAADLTKQVQDATDSGRCPQCGRVLARIKKKANKLEETSPVVGHILNHYFGLYDNRGRVKSNCIAASGSKESKPTKKSAKKDTKSTPEKSAPKKTTAPKKQTKEPSKKAKPSKNGPNGKNAT